MEDAGTSREQQKQKSKNKPRKIYRTRSVSRLSAACAKISKQSKNKTARPRVVGTKAIKSADPEADPSTCQQTVVSVNGPQNLNPRHIHNKQRNRKGSFLHVEKTEKPVKKSRVKMTTICRTSKNNKHPAIGSIPEEKEKDLLGTTTKELNETEESEYTSLHLYTEQTQPQCSDVGVKRTPNNNTAKSRIPSEIPKTGKDKAPKQTILRSLLQNGPQTLNPRHIDNKQSNMKGNSLHVEKTEKPVKKSRVKMTTIRRTSANNIHPAIGSIPDKKENEKDLLGTRAEELNETEKSEYTLLHLYTEQTQPQCSDVRVKRTPNNNTAKSKIPSEIPKTGNDKAPKRSILRSLLQNGPQTLNPRHIDNKQSNMKGNSLHVEKTEKPVKKSRVKMTTICRTSKNNIHTAIGSIPEEKENEKDLICTTAEELNETEESEYTSLDLYTEQTQPQCSDVGEKRTPNNNTAKSKIPSEIPKTDKDKATNREAPKHTIIRSLLENESVVEVLQGCIRTFTEDFEQKCNLILEVQVSDSSNWDERLNCPQTENVNGQKTINGEDEVYPHETSENSFEAEITELNLSKAAGVKNKKPVLQTKYFKTLKDRKIFKNPVVSTRKKKSKIQKKKQKVSSGESEDVEVISQHEEFEHAQDTEDELEYEDICNPPCKEALLQQMCQNNRETKKDVVRFSRRGVSGLVYPIGKYRRGKEYTSNLNKYVYNCSYNRKPGRGAKSLTSTLLNQYHRQKVSKKLCLMVKNMITLIRQMVERYLDLLYYVRDILEDFGKLNVKMSFRAIKSDLYDIRHTMNLLLDQLREFQEIVLDFPSGKLCIEHELLEPLRNDMKILHIIKPRIYSCYETVKMLRIFKSTIGVRWSAKSIFNTITTEVLQQLDILKEGLSVVQSIVRGIKRIL